MLQGAEISRLYNNTNCSCPISTILEDFPVQPGKRIILYILNSRVQTVSKMSNCEAPRELVDRPRPCNQRTNVTKSSDEANTFGQIGGETSHLRSHEWQIHIVAPFKPTHSVKDANVRSFFSYSPTEHLPSSSSSHCDFRVDIHRLCKLADFTWGACWRWRIDVKRREGGMWRRAGTEACADGGMKRCGCERRHESVREEEEEEETVELDCHI